MFPRKILAALAAIVFVVALAGAASASPTPTLFTPNVMIEATKAAADEMTAANDAQTQMDADLVAAEEAIVRFNQSRKAFLSAREVARAAINASITVAVGELDAHADEEAPPEIPRPEVVTPPQPTPVDPGPAPEAVPALRAKR